MPKTVKTDIIKDNTNEEFKQWWDRDLKVIRTYPNKETPELYLTMSKYELRSSQLNTEEERVEHILTDYMSFTVLPTRESILGDR